MGNSNDLRIVLGSLRYKSASNVDIGLNVPFVQTSKENVEFDRSLNINLSELYDRERQQSTNFRPTCKFSVLFKNAYTGYSNYERFEKVLSYVNENAAAELNCPTDSNVSWSGFPQYNEFDFIRTDYNFSGYTQPPNEHIQFVNKSASTYNWNYFLSYPFENDYTKSLQAIDSITNQTLQWVASDGIPFVLYSSTIGGLGLISFRCPVKHNLMVGEYVKLNFSYNGTDTYQVFSLGTGIDATKPYTFNIVNIGFTGSTFNNNTTGTFRRIINIDNPVETLSSYYVRKHKIISNTDDAVLVKAGFEQNIFGTKKKYESSGYTPNREARVSIREGAQSYTLSFNKDFDVNKMLDNQKRPVNRLFFTVLYKGYFGWMFGQLNPINSVSYVGMKQGYEFNLPLDESFTSPRPSPWWSLTNNLSNTNFPYTIYSRTQPTPAGTYDFMYINSFMSGDTLDGDFCEWNDYEQKERVISEIYHKLTYNPNVFNVISSDNGLQDNPLGFYYKPHYSIKIRDFSDYVERGTPKEVVGVPDYSYFSTADNEFRWRDIYTYGFIDNQGNGVNYPFFNDTHYPYESYTFRIIPEGTNYIESDINYYANLYGSASPIVDNCE